MNRFIPYSHQYIDQDDIDAVVRVLRSDYITQGPNVDVFENALCRYTGAKYAVAVSSGTAALHIACLAAGIKARDEVITSPITFLASANSVLYCGGRPVFADVQHDTINIDPKEIKTKIHKKTKALIPVHFAGHPCDMEEISAIADRNGLVVIEDAAHAVGAEYKGSKIGACKYSDMTIFSFHPVKSITTGEGGAVLTNKKDLYEKLLMLRSHGISRDRLRFVCQDQRLTGSWYYEMQCLGFNYRITDIQSALGLSQLKKLNTFVIRRRQIAETYNKKLCGIEDILLPVERSYVSSSYHIYCIRTRDPKDRTPLFNILRASGIGAQVHYIPVYLQPYYKQLGYAKGLCRKAEEFYGGEISIPMYPAIREREIDYVVKKIAGFFGAGW